MSAAHTPGPWVVHSSMRDCVTFQGKDGIENLFLQNLDGYFACQNEKDARLIAAAPDLLEALQYAVEQVPELATVPGIAAAIAKATGVAA